MKTPIPTLGVAVLCVLFASGCESSDGIPARVREKSAAYAASHLWQKRFIDVGVVASGFTPDMVYMAVGHPTTVEKAGAPGLEVWTYRNYYPSADARTMGFNLSGESTYQPHNMRTLDNGSQIPASMNPSPKTGNSAPESLFTTSGTPQGGSMEIADLQSFKLTVWFQNGKVAKLTVTPN